MNTWIYFNEKRGVWQVKWMDGNAAVVVAEFANRGDAYRFSAWGIR